MKKQITTHRKIEDHATLAQSQQTGERTFENVEEMLRFDSAQNSVPPAVEVRLRDSISRESPLPKNRSWWGRFLGG